jgi:hypothetical protein
MPAAFQLSQIAPSFARLVEIEALQDQVLAQLDDLNRRIEQVIGQYAPRPAESQRTAPRPAAA